MFAEILNNVRGDLIGRVKVDEALLSYMMKKSVINSRRKTEIQRVCTCIQLCIICVFSLVLSSFLYFIVHMCECHMY